MSDDHQPQNADETRQSVATPGLQVGDILEERYRIIEPLDAGGMGAIVRAEQLSMKRDVAIKLLHPSMADDEDTVRRFRREIDLAKQLVHPNVIQLFDTGQTDTGAIYLVMELLEGADLKDVIERDAPMTAGRTVDIIRQVADGLTEAHNLGIIHRDMKPANIFMVENRHRSSEHVKLLDFGIAKSFQGDETALTKAGHLVGTANYMAPELFLRAEPGPYTDIYSVGLIILEMLYGHRVVGGGSMAETVFQHMKQPLPMPERLKHSALGRVIQKASAKHPDDRYATAGALLEALDDLEGNYDRDLQFDPESTPITEGVPSNITSNPNLEGGDGLEVLRAQPSHITDESAPPTAPITPSPEQPRTDQQAVRAAAEAAGHGATAELSDLPGDQQRADREEMGTADVEAPGSEESDSHLVPIVIAAASLAVGLGLGAWSMAPGSSTSESEQARPADAPAEPESAAAPEPKPTAEPAEPDPTPPPEPVTIRVESEPAGARLLHDGESLGRTPYERETTASDTEQTWRLVKDGFEPVTLTVDLSADNSYAPKLTAKEPAEQPDDEPSPTTSNTDRPSDEEQQSGGPSPAPEPDPEPSDESAPADDDSSGDSSGDDINQIFDETEF